MLCLSYLIYAADTFRQASLRTPQNADEDRQKAGWLCIAVGVRPTTHHSSYAHMSTCWPLSVCLSIGLSHSVLSVFLFIDVSPYLTCLYLIPLDCSVAMYDCSSEPSCLSVSVCLPVCLRVWHTNRGPRALSRVSQPRTRTAAAALRAGHEAASSPLRPIDQNSKRFRWPALTLIIV